MSVLTQMSAMKQSHIPNSGTSLASQCTAPPSITRLTAELGFSGGSWRSNSPIQLHSLLKWNTMTTPADDQLTRIAICVVTLGLYT